MNAAFVAMWLVAASPAGVWPGFNGAGASAIDQQTLPVKWAPKENIAWKTDLPGNGQSSPVVWGDRVFVTYIDGKEGDASHVIALSLKTGEILWDHATPSLMKVAPNYYHSCGAPTPVVDADRVYVFFETGVAVAYDHAGKELWTRKLTEDYGEFKNEFGLGSSPVLVDGLMVILIDHAGPSYLLGLDQKTGETKWKTDRTSRRAWSSPVLVPFEGAQQIVCSSDGSIDGYDPKTGAMLWTTTEVGGNTNSSPYPFGDGKFLTGAGSGGMGGNPVAAKKSNMAMQIKRTETGYGVEVLWRAEQASTAWASPIVHDGRAYWVNRSGVVFCYDTATGGLLYNGRTQQSAWATPIGVGDRIYLFGKDGLTTVLSAGSQFEILAENQLWDPDEIPADKFPGGGGRAGGQGAGGQGGERGGREGGAGGAAGEGRPMREGGQAGGAAGANATGAPALSSPTAQPVPATQSSDSTAKPAPGERASEGNREGSQNAGAAQGGEGGRRGGPGGPGGGAGGGGAGGRGGPGGGGPGGLPADGIGRFPDPIQYGAAIVDGSIVVRTGKLVYCVRTAPAKQQ